jgi:hypothetical protein
MANAAAARYKVRLGVVVIFVFHISAGLLHVATVIIGYKAGGFIGACLSMFLPVISQLFWAWKIWQTLGFTWFHGALLFVICSGALSNFLMEKD